MRISKFQSRAASLWHCSFPARIKVLPVRSPEFQQFVSSEKGISKACM